MILVNTPSRSDLAYIKKLLACPETNKHKGDPYPMKDEAAWFSRWIEPRSPARLYLLICNHTNTQKTLPSEAGSFCYAEIES